MKAQGKFSIDIGQNMKIRIVKIQGLCFPCLLFLVCLLIPDSLLAQQPEQVTPPPAKVETIITKETVIEMKTGEKKRIQPDAKMLEVEVTRPEVAEGYLSGDQEIMLMANSPGVGKVILQLDNGSTVAYVIRVYVADPEKYAADLKEKLQNIRSLNIEVLKDKILVEGRVLYLKDMDAIERAIGDNPSVINLTFLTSRNARILAREIERELRESGIYGVEVEVRNNKVTLLGTLASNVLIRKAEKIASSFTPNFDSHLTMKEAAKR
jgi:Flp pilus assembly secretin CpaC